MYIYFNLVKKEEQSITSITKVKSHVQQTIMLARNTEELKTEDKLYTEE